MRKLSENVTLQRISEELTDFPFKKTYFVLVLILVILSLVGLTFETDSSNSNIWKVSADIGVSTTTLILLLVAWLPSLISWIVRLSPVLQQILLGLQQGGVEEIAAGILSIKLTSGVKQAADSYGSKVLGDNTILSGSTDEKSVKDLENSYRETIDLINSSERLDSKEANSRINQLALYYDLLRETMPPSRERTRLLGDITATMWALMSSMETFPVKSRLLSAKGGERLSAYKYIEWVPTTEYLKELLSRAAGILETPFGQYHALLALLRVVTTTELSSEQREEITNTLLWISELSYINQDRRNLIRVILSAL